jgi:hypothetical protein
MISTQPKRNSKGIWFASDNAAIDKDARQHRSVDFSTNRSGRNLISYSTGIRAIRGSNRKDHDVILLSGAKRGINLKLCLIQRATGPLHFPSSLPRVDCKRGDLHLGMNHTAFSSVVVNRKVCCAVLWRKMD